MRRHARLGQAIAVIGVLVIAVAGCGGGNGGGGGGGNASGNTADSRLAVSDGGIADPERTDVSITNFEFGPESFTTSAGSTVWWVNDGSAPHTVNSDDFGNGEVASGTIRTDKGFSYTFETAGEYTYFCNNHPGMEGTIIVE